MAKRRRLTIPAAKGPRLVERTPADLVVLGNRTDDPERIRAVIAEIERRAGAPYFQAELDRLRIEWTRLLARRRGWSRGTQTFRPGFKAR